jgi:hypothetical protein
LWFCAINWPCYDGARRGMSALATAFTGSGHGGRLRA